MALENSASPSRPDSLSLPVEDRGDGEEVEVATEATVSTGVFNVSQELGHVVTTETAPSPLPPVKVNKSFQAKMAEREANANQHHKKTQGTEKERGRFGWGEWATWMSSCTKYSERVFELKTANQVPATTPLLKPLACHPCSIRTDWLSWISTYSLTYALHPGWDIITVLCRVFFGPPFFLFPAGVHLSATLGNISLDILNTWPNHLSPNFKGYMQAACLLTKFIIWDLFLAKRYFRFYASSCCRRHQPLSFPFLFTSYILCYSPALRARQQDSLGITVVNPDLGLSPASVSVL